MSQTLIKQRADANGIRFSLEELRRLERAREYDPRIQQLRADILTLQSRIEAARAHGAGERADWDREVGGSHHTLGQFTPHQIAAMNAALDAALARLREVMGSLNIFATSE